jgi:DNA-directed RNA polymerase specialized sigma24 family protein
MRSFDPKYFKAVVDREILPTDSLGFVTTMMYDAIPRVFPDPDNQVLYLERFYGPLVEAQVEWKMGSCVQVEDLEDAHQNALMKLCVRLRQPGFMPANLLLLFYHIMRCEAVTLWRKQRRQAVAWSGIGLDPFGAEWEASLLGETVRRRLWLDGAAWAQFLRELGEEVARLPGCRQRVAALHIASYAELSEREKFAELAELMTIYTCEHVSAATIKSSWHAAARTLKVGMARRGYDLGEEWF